MKRFLIAFILFTAAISFADTPPPSAVKAKLYTGDGSQAIGSVSDSLKVNVTNSGGSSTVNQGTPNGGGASAWPVTGTIQVTQSVGTLLHATIDNFPSSFSVSNFPSTYPVTGTFWQTTQPVSLATLPPLATGSNTIGAISNTSFNVGNFPSTYPVTGTFWQTTQPVSAASLPLPSGAATSGNQATEISSLSSIDTKITTTVNGIKVDGSAITQPVSAASLPLPTGAATSANQTTGNTSLSTIATNTTNAATTTKQSDGSQKTQIVDGSGTVIGPAQTISGTNYAPVVLAASGTTGSAVPARTIQTGGTDGTNLRAFSTDTSGNQNVNVISNTAARTSVNLARNDYTSTNVTTAAYVQLIASTADTINQLYIFDSSGQTLFLAVGGAGSEVNKAYIVPGGNGILNLTIPASSRVSVKAVSGTASAGELNITFLK